MFPSGDISASCDSTVTNVIRLHCRQTLWYLVCNVLQSKTKRIFSYILSHERLLCRRCFKDLGGTSSRGVILQRHPCRFFHRNFLFPFTISIFIFIIRIVISWVQPTTLRDIMTNAFTMAARSLEEKGLSPLFKTNLPLRLVLQKSSPRA